MTNDKAKRTKKSLAASHAAQLAECRYCGASTDDIGRHYAKECVHVAIALDPDFWPYQEGSHEARNAKNARRNKKRTRGRAVVINEAAGAAYRSFNDRATQRPKRILARTVTGRTVVLVAGGDAVCDDPQEL